MDELDSWSALAGQQDWPEGPMNLEDGVAVQQQPAQAQLCEDHPRDVERVPAEAAGRREGQQPRASTVDLDPSSAADRSLPAVLGNARDGDLEIVRGVLHEVVQEGLDAAQGWSRQVTRMDHDDADGSDPHPSFGLYRLRSTPSLAKSARHWSKKRSRSKRLAWARAAAGSSVSPSS